MQLSRFKTPCFFRSEPHVCPGVSCSLPLLVTLFKAETNRQGPNNKKALQFAVHHQWFVVHQSQLSSIERKLPEAAFASSKTLQPWALCRFSMNEEALGKLCRKWDYCYWMHTGVAGWRSSFSIIYTLQRKCPSICCFWSFYQSPVLEPPFSRFLLVCFFCPFLTWLTAKRKCQDRAIAKALKSLSAEKFREALQVENGGVNWVNLVQGSLCLTIVHHSSIWGPVVMCAGV